MFNSKFKKIAIVLSVVVGFFAATSATAGDAAAGKTKAAACAGCHGVAGISAIPNFPNLAGQKSAYLAKQLKAFRDKTRADPTMAAIAGPLTDADIDDLSAYFESLK
ncbi:MAG: cytochrome c [Enterobacterales bacterium]|nr:cytochrome c [Enterobacterales bacterium]